MVAGQHWPCVLSTKGTPAEDQLHPEMCAGGSSLRRAADRPPLPSAPLGRRERLGEVERFALYLGTPELQDLDGVDLVAPGSGQDRRRPKVTTRLRSGLAPVLGRGEG